MTKCMNDAEFLEQLTKNIDERAEFWRTNPEDPHGIGTAVYVALVEVSHSLADAKKFFENREQE